VKPLKTVGKGACFQAPFLMPVVRISPCCSTPVYKDETISQPNSNETQDQGAVLQQIDDVDPVLAAACQLSGFTAFP